MSTFGYSQKSQIEDDIMVIFNNNHVIPTASSSMTMTLTTATVQQMINDSLTNERNITQIKIETLEKQIKEKTEQSDKKIDKLKHKNKELQNQLDAKNAHTTNSEQQINKISDKLGDIEKKTDKIDGIETTLMELKQNVKSNEDKVGAVDRHLSHVKGEFQNFKGITEISKLNNENNLSNVKDKIMESAQNAMRTMVMESNSETNNKKGGVGAGLAGLGQTMGAAFGPVGGIVGGIAGGVVDNFIDSNLAQ